MPRHSTITTTWESTGFLGFGTRKHEREYRVTYLDDSPGRKDAVEFFGRALVPAWNLPDAINKMPGAMAQKFLDDHPFQEKWAMLTLHTRDVAFENQDLYRLEFLRELERIHSHADHLTDSGVRFFRLIPELRHLLIYSPLVTDACLEDVAALTCLETIDFQGSPGITKEAFARLVGRLDHLVDIYPPFHGIEKTNGTQAAT